MSFAFRIDAVPTRGLRVLHAAMIALAVAGFGWAAWLASPPWSVVWLAAAVPACAAAWWRGMRGLSWGRLSVDERGQCRWLDPGEAPQEAGRPVRIERWCATERLAWLRLREARHGRRHDVLLARDACVAAQWRSLRTWLTWLGRGPEVPPEAAAPRARRR